MKRMCLTLMILCMNVCTYAASNGGYLFVTFRGEATPMTEQIYFMVSKDGLDWTAMNNAEPVLVSTVGEKGVRDPYILRSHDNQKFYMIATDLSINLTNHDWNRAQTAASQSIVIWESEDLVQWSQPCLVKVAPDNAGCTWAPEAVYDAEREEYMVFWASKTSDDNYRKHRIWAARTKDFKTFDEPFVYIEKPNTVIDTTIIRENGVYYRFTKDEQFKAITMETSSNLMDGWKNVEDFSLTKLTGYEGPTCFMIEAAGNDQPAKWCLLLDWYSRGRGYQPYETANLSQGSFVEGKPMNFPFNPVRHGTVLAITQAEMTRLVQLQQKEPQEKSAAGTATAPRIAVEKAPAPLYDDPVWHGASDPAVVWLPGKGEHGEYWMYYTQRRAALENPNGVDWVHGSAIGIAASTDGLQWTYHGTIQGTIKDGDAEKSLSNPVKDGITWWAPTVFWEKGNGISGGGQPGDRLHMFVTYVHGIFTSWTGDRTIEHFISTDGLNWTYVSPLPLASRRAIDPTVYKIGDTWYLWYKNEATGSRTFRVSSKDLTDWKDEGDADIGRSHEAPFVWHWKDAYWNLHDSGRGLDAWRSDNGLSGWSRNTVLLLDTETGRRKLDHGFGHHPWIVLQSPASGKPELGSEQLILFYFTHDGQKTYMQMAEITLGSDGKLLCDRNKYFNEEAIK